jgi:hypothetical protein
MSETEEKKPDAINVRKLVNPEELAKDISFSDTDLTTAMIEQPSLFIHYGGLSARAQKQADDIKILLEVTEAKLDKQIRDTAAETGEKITEAAIKQQIARHPRIVQINKALNEARMIQELCKTACEAFRQRRDMLVQIGATAREEMKGEVAVRSAEARERAAQELRDRVKRRLSEAA